MITAPRPGARGAVVLLSGGIDSATVLAVARSEGFAPYALSFSYGQRHRRELTAAAQVAAAQGVARHLVLDVDASVFGGSALTDPAIDVPAGPAVSVDATYVPARNTVFLSLALAWAETVGAQAIFIGVNAGDHAGYPDCRPGYLTAFQEMAALATSAGPAQIRAPLIRMTKTAVIRHGLRLGVDYTPTLSCYNPAPGPCGACGACSVRAAAFTELGVPDPALAGDRR
jgi:7-cyano-7-deazaguanine synthase